MAHPRQSVLILTVILLAGSALGRRFYSDDPLAKEPPPMAVGELRAEPDSDPGTFIHDTLRQRGQKDTPPPALDINTIDELPDSSWFTNRNGANALSNAGLAKGPGGNEPPAADQPWSIFEADEGTSPIFRIEDSHGRRFALRFDPKEYVELSTGADVVGSKLFYALGYNVPDDYAVRFQREQLHAGPGVHFLRDGQRVVLRESDIDHLLSLTPRYPDGSYRALASRLIEGSLLGPFEYSSTRGDDPNDTIPHERRRALRALFVFSEWIDHIDTRVLGTLDTIQPINGVRAVRHFLTDFGSSFGSGNLRPKEAWEGHTYAVDFRWGLKEVLTLGAYSPKWARTPPAIVTGAGSYEGDTFDPAAWKPAYPNAAFDCRTAADNFWAAKQIGAFTDDQIRALVRTGRYSDPKAVEAMVQAMILRRNKIVAYYFARTLPLDRFEVNDGKLHYRDLGGNGNYTIAWTRFENETDAKFGLKAEPTFAVPRSPGYLAADIGDGTHRLTVYVHDGRVVGLIR